MVGVRFQRGNHMVADLDKALTFYRDVLGFDVTYILPPNPDSYSYPVFAIPLEAVMRFCVLSTEAQARVMALTEVKNTPLPAVPHPRRSAIVLEIDDPDGVSLVRAPWGLMFMTKQFCAPMMGGLAARLALSISTTIWW